VQQDHHDARPAQIIGVDGRRRSKGRKQHMNFMKDWYAEHTNPFFNEKGKFPT